MGKPIIRKNVDTFFAQDNTLLLHISVAQTDKYSQTPIVFSHAQLLTTHNLNKCHVHV